MVPKAIIVKNFLSYGALPQRITFEQGGLIFLSGSNGHGKSALLEAITWALWGMARRPQGKTKCDLQLMHLGSKTMSVTLVFESGRKRYSVKRAAERTGQKVSTTLEVYQVNHHNEIINDLSEGSQKETQERINQLAGIDYDTFINTSFLRQGLSNEFTKKTPFERKEILTKILNIEHIESLRVLVGERLRRHQQELLVQQGMKKSISAFLEKKEETDEIKEKNNQKLTAYKKIKEEILAKKTVLQQEKEKEKLLREKRITMLQELQQCTLTMAQKKTTLKEHVSLLRLAKRYLCSLRCTSHGALRRRKGDTLTPHFQRGQRYKERIIRFTRRVTLLQEALKAIEESKRNIMNFFLSWEEFSVKNNHCFFCGSTAKKEKKNIETLLTPFFEKKTGEKTEKLTHYEMVIKKITPQYQQSVRLFDTLAASPLFTTTFSSDIALLRQNIIEKILQRQALRKEWYALQEKNTLQEREERSLREGGEREEQAYQKLITDAEFLYREIATIKAMQQSKAQEKDLWQKKYEECERSIEEKSFTIEVHNDLYLLLSKEGIQSLLIEEAIPLIEAEANALLKKITRDDCALALLLTRDLQSGKLKDTLDIMITDSFGTRPYEFFSGGESFRIDLALRISLAKMLTHRAGASLRTFIIDEGFGSQDSESLDMITHALYSLQSEFDLIIIVSHLLPMKEQFSVHYLVQKGPRGSTVFLEDGEKNF